MTIGNRPAEDVKLTVIPSPVACALPVRRGKTLAAKRLNVGPSGRQKARISINEIGQR